ncbi:MAG TPA: glycosyltransferase [Anaerolineae bacterium]|nr:glycosyltransferase [Anaerolineae bacterium]
MGLTWLALLISLILIGIAAIAIVNVLTFPRLDAAPPPPTFPLVSLLVPARNEAAGIAETVRRLLAQDYPCYELLLLDDHSTDGTADVARAAAGADARLRLLQGAPLPTGWQGKSWACHQLAEAAHGELLVFTDADVAWEPGALARLVGEMQRRGSDLQTVWPTQITVTWGERLIVPLLAFVIVGYLPVLAVHHIPWSIFAAAIGQCLAFRRSAYHAIGGHAAVRASIMDDMAFAKAIKQRRLKLRMADAAGLIRCRMYRHWTEVRDGFAKNILAGHSHSLLLLLLSWAFHWLVFLAPWVWLGLGWLGGPPGWPLWPLCLIGLGVGVRAISAALSRQRLADALWLPVSVILMARIATQAIAWKVRHGGVYWKGRLVQT